jgi:hypothetical protein
LFGQSLLVTHPAHRAIETGAGLLAGRRCISGLCQIRTDWGEGFEPARNLWASSVIERRITR